MTLGRSVIAGLDDELASALPRQGSGRLVADLLRLMWAATRPRS